MYKGRGSKFWYVKFVKRKIKNDFPSKRVLGQDLRMFQQKVPPFFVR